MYDPEFQGGCAECAGWHDLHDFAAVLWQPKYIAASSMHYAAGYSGYPMTLKAGRWYPHMGYTRLTGVSSGDKSI